MLTSTRSPVLVVILALSLACAGDSGSGASDEAPVPEWTLEQEGRIGSLDDPDQMLDDVDQVVIGPEGLLFVPQDNEIWVFDSAGVRTGTIGREGEGPGDFTSLRNVGLVGDTLYAVHGGQISRFTLDGRYLTSRRLAGEQFSRGTAFYLPSSPRELVPVGDGGALATPNLGFSLPGGSEPGVKHIEIEIPFFRFGADLELQDTVVWQDLSSTGVWLLHGGEIYTLSSPWGDAPWPS